MARIRSVHPGLFTDDKFASLSLGAQVLFIGLWTECDDQGAFEWNPVKLKMRIVPVHHVEVSELLAELQAANMVRSYSHEGRKLGAVRNFTRFQRPKKPNSVYFMPPEFRTYAGLTTDSSEPDEPERPPVPQKSEKSPQMEGRGEKEGGKGKEAPSTSPTESPTTPSTKPKLNGQYAFSGHVVQLAAGDLETWRTTYHGVPDLLAEIRAADAYYTDHPPKGGKWFFAVSNWLKRAHNEALAKARSRDSPAQTHDPRL